MPFTGKATYSAGATLPELAEDVADLVTILSSHETPLLDALGDAGRFARSTVHEWIEDSLSATSVAIAGVASATLVAFDHAERVRVGDQLLVADGGERVLVSAINVQTGQATLTRGYGGSASTPLEVGKSLVILGNAALEGDDASAARFTNRARRSNVTQIFSATCEVSGSELAVRQLGVGDEMDYQKSQRLRELLRDLENSVINGLAPVADPQGSATVRRTMRGVVGFLDANAFTPDALDVPATPSLNEAVLNAALRALWQRASSNVDLIVVGGREKRRINEFVATNRRFSGDAFRDVVSTYESDYGACRVLLSRYVPNGTVLLLDSTKIDVLPLAGRSFQYRPLAVTGDRACGQVIGEYTLEVRNAAGQGKITGLTE